MVFWVQKLFRTFKRQAPGPGPILAVAIIVFGAGDIVHVVNFIDLLKGSELYM